MQSISAQPKQKSLAEFYLPNFLALSVLWIGLFATAVPIVRDRDGKILLRIGATPVTPAVLMAGLTLWRLTLGLLQTVIFLGVGIALLGLTMPDNIGLLALAVVLGNLAFISMGYMIAAISPTVESAGTLTQLFNFPMMFLSGIFFASDMLPPIVTKISYIIPLTYLADSYRQIVVGYPGMIPLWISFSVLAVFGLICSAIALKHWRWA